jgi:hypothetical protein
MGAARTGSLHFSQKTIFTTSNTKVSIVLRPIKYTHLINKIGVES